MIDIKVVHKENITTAFPFKLLLTPKMTTPLYNRIKLKIKRGKDSNSSLEIEC